ncbi:E3 ubiquitin-protein ligase [Striga asiatica]|uniref:E3 ubiquitin-protein ligase n=1 Tax=Striga asiatica TaxID=4170 RepID=A0A5A7Q3E3_STRAF|nr:E3 ubiquitin-protein ligase [Striga asiatica]
MVIHPNSPEFGPRIKPVQLDSCYKLGPPKNAYHSTIAHHKNPLQLRAYNPRFLDRNPKLQSATDPFFFLSFYGYGIRTHQAYVYVANFLSFSIGFSLFVN